MEEDELPNNAWETIAFLLRDHAGFEISDAKDRMIKFYLQYGDMRPFSYWVLEGHTPSREVMVLVANLAMEG